MKLRTLILAGAAAAYLCGTDHGRQLVVTVRGKALEFLGDPQVHAKVRDFSEKATDFAKEASTQVSQVVADAAVKASEYVKEAAEQVSERA